MLYIREMKTNREQRHERKLIRKQTKQTFIPLYGSFKYFFKNTKRDGQVFRYYILRLIKDFKFTCRSSLERMWYGQSVNCYYDLNDDILIYLRNGILALSKLTLGYNSIDYKSYEEWLEELNRISTVIDKYLSSNNGNLSEEKSCVVEITDWLSNNIEDLWD